MRRAVLEFGRTPARALLGGAVMVWIVGLAILAGCFVCGAGLGIGVRAYHWGSTL